MKKAVVALSIALLISLGYNVYSGSTAVSPCDDSRRYSSETAGGGADMALTEMSALVQEYKTARAENKDEFKTTGFLISKRVCDDLFSNPTTNALTLDLFVKDGQLNLAIRGTHTTKSGIEKKSASADGYVVRTFCPDDCSTW